MQHGELTLNIQTTLCDSHMREILDGKLIEDSKDWKYLLENKCADKERLESIIERGGWTAAVDFPASICWEQLMEIYPNAKVIHTERISPEKWWESASNSIMVAGKKPLLRLMVKFLPFWKAQYSLMGSLYVSLAKKRVDRSHPGWPSIYKNEFLEAYSANNDRVRELVPSDRLLIQDHGKGWILLAKFLGKDIPDKPYPYKNTRSEFKKWMKGYEHLTKLGLVIVAISIMFIYGLAKYRGLTIYIRSKKNKMQ